MIPVPFKPLPVVDPSDGREFNIITREAAEMANRTVYGLFLGLWTNDGSHQLRLVHRFKSGQVFINNYAAGGGVPLSFCGIKLSEHGHEMGFEALYRFSITKTVPIKHG